MVYGNVKSSLAWSITGVGAITLGAVLASYWFYGRPTEPTGTASTQPQLTAPSSRANADAWTRGLDLGWQAAVAAQTADSETAWRQVGDLWIQAIAALKQVPQTSPHFPQVQAKIQEYLANFEVAEQEKSRVRSPQAAIGLNLSRQTLQQAFEAPSYGFKFQPADVVDGQPRLVGRSADGTTTVALIGPVQNLDQAILQLPLSPPTAHLRMQDLIYANRFLATAVPNWDDRTHWLATSLQQLQAHPQQPLTLRLQTQTISLQADVANHLIVIEVSPDH